MNYLIFILAVVAVAWWFKSRSKSSSEKKIETRDTKPPTHGELIRTQMEFERRLESENGLPDGILGRDAYIYWNLMRNWFDKLAAENRYAEETLNKLQQDWSAYMELLPQMKRARFLAMELEDQQKAAAYDQEATQAARSIKAIRDAFAARIGHEATETLLSIRDRAADAFDRTGKRDVAPAGHQYFPVSISPYVEECRPKPTTDANANA